MKGQHGWPSWPYQSKTAVCILLSVFFTIFFYMNTCWVPHLQMSPKHFTTATIALFPASELTHCALVICNCERVTSFTQHILNIPPEWLQCCLVVIWLVPCETVAVSAQVLCTPNKPCTSLECHYWKPHMKGARVFNCKPPPALWAELGSFRCYCGNTGKEWGYPNQSAQKADPLGLVQFQINVSNMMAQHVRTVSPMSSQT